MNFISTTVALLGVIVVTAVGWVWSGYGSWLTATDTRHDVTTDQVRAWQADDGMSDGFVLVDVREQSEYSISMLPNAITLDDFEATIAEHHGKVVIAYCTVGVRSGAYAERLRQQGWDAYNYRGGILDWCQNELPLITADGQPTSRVHTYSSWYCVPACYLAVAK